MNENQKKTTEQYRSNYDQIFRPKRRDKDDGVGVQGIHDGVDAEKSDTEGKENNDELPSVSEQG